MHSPSTCKMKLWTNRSDIIFQFLAVIIHLVIRISCDFTVTSIDKPITEDLLLCRGCGNNLSSTELFINNLVSKEAKYAKNETLFVGIETLVQELENLAGQTFRVVLVKQSECRSNQAWSDYNTWFKGYSYRSCICTRCGAILGWMFEPSDNVDHTTEIPSKEGFYALILTGIVDEHFVDSLLMREKIFRD